MALPQSSRPWWLTSGFTRPPVNVGVVWVLGILMDYYQKRWPVIAGAAIFGLVPSIMMTIWTIPLPAKMFAYFAQYALQSTTPAIFTWLSDLLPHDAELRALLLGISITFYVRHAPLSRLAIRFLFRRLD